MKKNITSYLIIGGLIAASFFVGTLYSKVQIYEKGGFGDGGGQQPIADAGAAGNTAPAAPETAEDVPPVTKEDYVKGDRNARIALIEYSDFECPFCARFHPTAQQVVDENKDVMWVFRHYPLAFHQNAQMEAEASECIAEQGGNDGFWKFADTLFERTTSTGTSFNKDQLADMASEIGFDKGKFSECLDSGKYTQKVQDQMAAGTAAGVSGTPGNILLDTKTGKTRVIPGAVPYEQVKQAIDSLLSEA